MLFDTHEELLIQPYRQGVKLIKPENTSISLPSIGNLFAMPVLVYFVTPDACFVDANHFTHVTNIPGNKGYYSDLDLRGTAFSKCFNKEAVHILSMRNNHILNIKKMIVCDEHCIRLDDIDFATITFKFPVYDVRDKAVGIFGISVLTSGEYFSQLEKPSLSEALQQIINTGLIQHNKLETKSLLPGFSYEDIYLSNQEMKCIRLLIAGKTMKSIGLHLGLSPRTVEHYLENVKRKLHVKTKSELIEKVVQHIWPEILM